MLRNHDLNLLPVFATLMQEMHLSKAAERLNMSQPAVSNALKRLRHEFGDELFVRTGRGLSPTQRAIDLYGRIAPALGLVRDSFEEQPSFDDTFSRTVEISMNHAVEHIWSHILMQEARKRAPNTIWKIHNDNMDDIPARLKDGRLSFAVEYTSLPDDQYSSMPLITEDLTLICASNHPQIKGSISLNQFGALPHVSLIRRSRLVRAQNNRRATPLEYLLGSSLPERRIVLQMSSFVSIPEVVATTDLIAVVPSRIASPLVNEGRLQSLPLPFDAPEIQVRLYWHKSRDSDPGHMWLAQLLETAAQVLETSD